MATIVGEAERDPAYCPHVETPSPPVVVYGVSPAEAAAAAEAWAKEAKDARGHTLRKDGHCLLAGTTSVPDDIVGTWENYKKLTVAWLQERYGSRLKSVVEHVDENYRHLHFFVVPLKGERFDAIHEGLRAANEANPDRGNRTLSGKAKTEGRKLASAAYDKAMSAYQTSFHDQVTRRFGLTRDGPKRAREPRAVWKARQEHARQMAHQVQLNESWIWQALTPQEQRAITERLKAQHLEAVKKASQPRGKDRDDSGR